MITRRNFGRALALAPLGYAAASQADDSYPNRPIRLLVGLAPGGIADITARFIAPRLGEILGRQVIVENRTGAGGAIATRTVANSAPDGYTLLMAFDGTHVTLPAANPPSTNPPRPLNDAAAFQMALKERGTLVSELFGGKTGR